MPPRAGDEPALPRAGVGFAALVWTRIKLSTSLVDILGRRLQLT